ncbi:MAG: glycosyltransferase family 2 protein [Jatrophihabitans sp.]|uniref:glycosyltransferase family 2 protein n=1 Tax=Jatrophihabitans sp. TaxID=1932789 RepID=UPI003F7F1F44
MQTTVVIACHTDERWRLLRAAIESVLRQTAPPAELIVVVDHNPGLQRRLEQERLPITVLANASERGASGARNTGASAAATEIICFLDDDAEADPDWLEALVAPFASPQVVGTGGHVRPGWSAAAPRWFPVEFAWVVGATHRGFAPADGRVRNVWAENMAVRREAFDAVGGFRTGFGKLGNHSRPEDTDLCIRMAATDGEWRYVERAAVVHHVPPERSTFGFFVRRCYHEGRGKAELSDLLGTTGALTTERRYTTVVLPTGVLRECADAVRRPRSGAALRAGAIVLGLAATVWGYLAGRVAAARGRG